MEVWCLLYQTNILRGMGRTFLYWINIDVFVQFENSHVRIVFRRGTWYSPASVIENGQWMADQSAVNFDNINGCFKRMNDPYCNYSHARILENTPVRAVVHWRYLPVSLRKQLLQVDEITDWSKKEAQPRRPDYLPEEPICQTAQNINKNVV